MENKVWFITGASRGLGRVWAEAALKRGDQVTATARNAGDLADLKKRFGDAVLPLALDVTESTQPKRVVQEAFEHFGRLDVLVNNAGSSLIATVEEADDHHIRDLFDANLFGMVRVLKAALPLLRKQGSGHILGVSSSLGIVPMPLIGFYAASKAAVESLHESMAQEIKAFGIDVTLIEPGAYATDFGKSARRADAMEAYKDFRTQVMAKLGTMKRGNPDATADAILKLVDADNPPLRFALGSTVLPAARTVYADRIATWEAWKDISNAAQGQLQEVTAASS